jgi:uncharacterized repeat protein (TIGR01451 family)
MIGWRRNNGRTGLARWRRKSPAMLALALLLALAQVQTAVAAIVNSAVATANSIYGPVSSNVAVQSVNVAAAAPAMTVTKTGTLNDDDGTPGLSAGDTISYTVTVANAGNVTLTGIGVSDPLVALTYQSGDTDSDSQLDIGETWTYAGSYTLLQNDLNTNGGGDGDIDNTVTVSSAQLPPQTASTAVAINPTPGLAVAKTVATVQQLFVNIYEIEYVLTATNTGNVALTNLRMSDDLSAAFAPGSVASTPSVTLTGFSGTGGPNPGFNGVGNTEILAGDVQLAAGQSGEIRVVVRIAQPGASATNQAFGSSDQLGTPVATDDPTVTPGNSSDINPTVTSFSDADNDGAQDGLESSTGDRDGDGVPDQVDYDPTGYFYCQSDGRIMAGGLITVTNLTGGGSQSGIGTNGNITVVRDGSSGQYEFRVNAAGTYRLTYTLPPGGQASTTRLPLAPLDVTSLLPANPGVLGSGEFGSTGRLADFSAAANPFHIEFDIEAGDPEVFNNNIPLQFCGSPQLGIAKQVTAGPALQGDGRSLLTWRVTVTNTGDEPVNQVQVDDGLAAVFGAANYQIVSSQLSSAPVGFAATSDPFYDGSGNVAMLTAGGTLQPGERVDLDLTLLVSVVTGSYVNTAQARGTSPLDGSPIGPVSANSNVDLIATGSNIGLVVAKTAGVATARLGDRVPYTITYQNPLTIDYYDVILVDQIPAGFTYVAGSATIDGVAADPAIAGRELTWTVGEIEAGETVTLRLTLAVGAAAAGSEFVNYAYARDQASDATISNIARATVRRTIEPVFDCADVIGRVFEDRNRDGYFDDGEPGVAAVRVATARGLLVTTDDQGRFHVTCAMIPASDIGSNFILKLDERSLPQAWRVTTENPRVIRLTRGKSAKLNFGVAPLRIVRLELGDTSFVSGGTRLTTPALGAVAGLLGRLESEQSLLRIIYGGTAETSLAEARLATVRTLVEQAWRAKPRPFDLVIDTAREQLR